MKFGKTGKINFEAVITASVAGMAYTVATNAISNSQSPIGAKWNENKDLNYALGATALGAGLMYFLPKQKWTNAAGLGLIGAGGAVAAQVITSRIAPGGSGLNGFLSNALGKAKKVASLTPAGLAAGQLKKLMNRNAACACDDNVRRDTAQGASRSYRIDKRRQSINGVGPGSYAELAAFDALGFNN